MNEYNFLQKKNSFFLECLVLQRLSTLKQYNLLHEYKKDFYTRYSDFIDTNEEGPYFGIVSILLSESNENLAYILEENLKIISAESKIILDRLLD